MIVLALVFAGIAPFVVYPLNMVAAMCAAGMLLGVGGDLLIGALQAKKR